MLKRGDKGVSPIIATVILVAIVIASGTIVFMWFRGFIQEKVIKFGKNVELVCEDVNFDASYAESQLSIVNRGNVPIFGMKIKIFEDGSYETKDLKDDFPNAGWPEGGLGQGEAFSGNIQSEVSGKEKIIVIPVLVGSSKEGKKVFTCGDQYGKEIIL